MEPIRSHGWAIRSATAARPFLSGSRNPAFSRCSASPSGPDPELSVYPKSNCWRGRPVGWCKGQSAAVIDTPQDASGKWRVPVPGGYSAGAALRDQTLIAFHDAGSAGMREM